MVAKLPAWLGSDLTREGIERIEVAVRMGESKTLGEIVPVVVRRSTQSGVLPWFGAALGLSGVLIVKTQGLDPWGPSLAWVWGVLYGAAMVLGYSLASLSAVQRWLLPASEQKEAVEQRALLEFYAAHLDRTERGTGILLFVSLLEHRAVVLADKGIAQHCQPQVFDDVVVDLIQGAKSGDLAAGFVQAIARSADLLAPHFPPLATDKNELKDYLRIKE